MTDWATPRRQSDTYSRGAAWWHATSLRWWRGQRLAALINWQRTVATICMAVAALWHSQCGTHSHTQCGSCNFYLSRRHPEHSLESSLRMQRTNWQLAKLAESSCNKWQAGRQRCAANCAATFNWQLLARSATFPLSIYDDDKRETGRQTDGQADGQTEAQAQKLLRGKTGGTYWQTEEQTREQGNSVIWVNLTSFLVLPNQYENANWTENKVENLSGQLKTGIGIDFGIEVELNVASISCIVPANWLCK